MKHCSTVPDQRWKPEIGPQSEQIVKLNFVFNCGSSSNVRFYHRPDTVEIWADLKKLFTVSFGFEVVALFLSSLYALSISSCRNIRFLLY